MPSRNNLTGVLGPGETAELSGRRGLAFVGRRQTHSLFDFTVDLSFDPQGNNEEAGVTVFLTQMNHIDLGVVRLSETEPQLSLRFRAEGTGMRPQSKVVPVPNTWSSGPIQLQVQAVSTSQYELSAMPVDDRGSKIVVESASGQLLSGGTGSFVGSLVGIYATCNGEGTGVECPGEGKAIFQRWRYTGEAQYITATETVPEDDNTSGE